MLVNIGNNSDLAILVPILVNTGNNWLIPIYIYSRYSLFSWWLMVTNVFGISMGNYRLNTG
jgi:hypothetical protein